MIDTVTEFHKLWVIESLPKGELRTGQRLVDNQLSQAKLDQPNLEVAYETPDTKKQLLQVLGVIRDEARNDGIYPMIHFECHGCKDGLAAADWQLIEWEEIRTLLIQINKSCKLNLVIVLAACNGIHLIKVATKLDHAPFWAAIGPDIEITAGEIDCNFAAFYTTYFETLDGDAAINALNMGRRRVDRKYHFFTAEGIFIKAYARFLKEHCSGKGRQKRMEELLSQALKDPKVEACGIKWARQQVKNLLADDGERGFNKMKKRFFFIDCFPENADRFELSYGDALAIGTNIRDWESV